MPAWFPPAAALAALVTWAQLLAVILYAAAQLLLIAYASHRYLLLWRWRRPAHRADASHAAGGMLPTVTVQLPVYNESRVVERLIDAAAALEYPAGLVEIQVLDDSDDETRGLAAAAVARQRAHGVDIHHLHRPRRDGFKAGALAAGLARARGELVAVFDADFVPSPDFLLRLAPRFTDPRVGMAQARWGHLNRGRSLLTAAQAAMLDAHFLIEHRARSRAGLFFNFNGAAGIWRRACIEDSGGWSHDTLTEDLDLSYRAQLRGWRFVFDETVEAPAELPADMEALKSQQRRWTRGSIQTARKLLPRLWRAPLPIAVKLEALVHLTVNVSYPLVVGIGVLLLPALLTPVTLPVAWIWAIQAAVLLLGTIPFFLFLGAAGRAAGRSLAQVIRDVPAALLLSVGLSLNNARAVVGGLGSSVGAWERTPKTGETARRTPLARYPTTRGPAGRSELALAAWLAATGIVAWQAGHAGALPFIALLVSGYGWVGLASARASGRSRALLGAGGRG